MPADDNNRNFSRAPLSRVVRYREESAQTFRSGPLSNISMGGMFIRTSDPLPQGTRIYLQFMLENGEIIAEGWARVIHVDSVGEPLERGMGIEFTNIDEKFIAFTQLVVSQELIQSRLQR